MNNIPKLHKLSTASQLSLLAIVILIGAIFFTVNNALQQQQHASSHASYAGIVSGHVYRLSNRCSPGNAMDVSNNATANGAHIIQWSWVTNGWNKDREWLVKDLGNGYYSIRSMTTLKYLNASNTFEGGQIVQSQSSLSPLSNEQWQIIGLGNGYYKIIGRQSGKAIGLYSCSASSGLNIRQYTYSGQQRLQWKLIDLTVVQLPSPNVTCTPPPSCYQNGVMICTIPIGGWCHITPAPTCTPPPPCLFTTPRCMITVPVGGWCRVTPTPTFVPGSTLLSFAVGLHGIGTAGDSANPNSTGNMDPLHPTRVITVQVYDVQNQLVASQEGTILYNKTTGKFNGTVNLGSSFATGLYTVKVKTDQYLRALVPGIQTITAGKTNTLPLVTLIAGDINGDNVINIIDYNILIGCYSDLLPATNCSATNKVLSDLNDDGHVNMYDYNLFLRELTNIGGQ